MRQYVLVCYDVADPKRWRKVYKIMRGNGEHIQYSVFLCQLSDKQEAALRVKLEKEIHHQEDQVLFVRIGPVTKSQLEDHISTVGRDFIPLNLAKLFF